VHVHVHVHVARKETGAGILGRSVPEWVLVVMHHGKSWTVPLQRPGSYRTGRSADCEIQIDEGRVSRLHALFTVDEAGVTLADQGSQNGTALVAIDDDGELSGPGRAVERKLEPHAAVQVPLGAMIHIGSAVLVLGEGSEGEPAAEPPPGLVVRDPAMVRLHQLVTRVAPSDLSVVLLGESGVGKEVVARRIHDLSPRQAGAFVAVTCSALAEPALESELFGHERARGLFEVASGGTMFLDEVGELSPAFQDKLLRVLEERAVGGTEVRSVDVRVLSATNRDLEAEVSGGRFRQDLYYRLNGIALVIPPLRERTAEIEPLARLFIERAAERARRSPPGLSDAARDVLLHAAWPGNIRELRDVIDRALDLCTGEVLEAEHLGLRPPTVAPLPVPPRMATPDPVAQELHQVAAAERRRIQEALEACGGNQTRAAELLGITRRMLIRRLDKYGLPRPRRKPD
jgi:two-component system response regulator AtoC